LDARSPALLGIWFFESSSLYIERGIEPRRVDHSVESVRRTVLTPNVMFCNALGSLTAGKCPLLSVDHYGRSWRGKQLYVS
jgi:hypothetical protein